MDGNTIETMMSSEKTVYETPQWLFDFLNELFGFTLDVCATAKNAKVKKYITPKKDALKQQWNGRWWMNPPYGRQIGSWVKRAAYFGKQEGNLGVCLLPARTETAWFQTLWDEAELLLFLRGRLKFGGGDSAAPFPSVIPVFWHNDHPEKYIWKLRELGNVVVRDVAAAQEGIIWYSRGDDDKG
jgi:phage N-6-adenine-methyltransferase